MKERNIILKGVVPAAVAVALLIFVGLVLAAEPIEVSITPKSLSLTKGEPTWLRCYATLPDPYHARNVEECTLNIKGEIQFVYADKVGCEPSQEGNVAVFFDCDEVKKILTGPGDVTLTLTIELEDGTIFVGSDTITVR